MYPKGRLFHPSTRYIVHIVLRELLTPDIQRVERIRSIGVVFQ